MTPEQIEIAIVEGILNEDFDQMRRLEKEQKELAGIAQWLGRDDSTTMRLWERLSHLNQHWTSSLHSFEWNCRRLQELRGIDA